MVDAYASGALYPGSAAAATAIGGGRAQHAVRAAHAERAAQAALARQAEEAQATIARRAEEPSSSSEQPERETISLQSLDQALNAVQM